MVALGKVMDSPGEEPCSQRQVHQPPHPAAPVRTTPTKPSPHPKVAGSRELALLVVKVVCAPVAEDFALAADVVAK